MEPNLDALTVGEGQSHTPSASYRETEPLSASTTSSSYVSSHGGAFDADIDWDFEKKKSSDSQDDSENEKNEGEVSLFEKYLCRVSATGRVSRGEVNKKELTYAALDPELSNAIKNNSSRTRKYSLTEQAWMYRERPVIVSLEGETMLVNISQLFIDDCTSQGNCCNKYLGLRDIKYWYARYAFGPQMGEYNSLISPIGLINPTGDFRRRLIVMVDSPWFNRAVLAAIFANAICLAIDIPSTKSNQDIQDFLKYAEYTFLGLFSVEAILKIGAMGFVMNTDSYLMEGVREGAVTRGTPNWWNLIDFIIVLLAWVGLHPDVTNISVIRSLRLLRPLKALHSVEGLQILLKALLSSLGPLWNVVILLFFFMIMFAITGVLIWEGTWHQRCYVNVPQVIQSGPQELLQSAVDVGAATWISNLSSAPLLTPAVGEMRSLDGWISQPRTLANFTGACTTVKFGSHCNINDAMTEYSFCQVGGWKRSSYLNFDTTLSAFLLVFKVISLDDWPDDMSIASDAVGQWAFVYFLAVTLFGSFFTMNLVLAILCGDFATISQEIRDDKQREVENASLQIYKFRVSVATIHFSFMRLAIAVYGAGMMRLPSDDNPEECIARLVGVFTAINDSQERSMYQAREGRANRRLGLTPPSAPSQGLQRIPATHFLESSAGVPSLHDEDSVIIEYKTHATGTHDVNSPSTQSATDDFLTKEALTEMLRNEVRSAGLINGAAGRTESQQTLGLGSSSSKEVLPPILVPRLNGINSSHEWKDDDAPLQTAKSVRIGEEHIDENVATEGSSERTVESENEEVCSDNDYDDSSSGSSSTLSNSNLPWNRRRHRKVGKLVGWKWFNRTIVFIIGVNIIVMCIDHHGISSGLLEFVEITSFVCNCFFLTEVILKIVGLSISGYFGNYWNMFDFVLVAISIPEMVTMWASSSEGSGGVTALRALRAFRVTRLLRRYKSLQQVVTTIMRSLSSAAYLSLIMLLFIFVYTVLGVQLFAESFPEDERNNFSSLWQAAITVFVVITGEKWASIMHVAMQQTNPSAALYFISLFSLGNYIFMNLFIAILIDNFAHMHNRETAARKAREEERKRIREEKKKKKKAKQRFASEMARREMMKWDSQGLDDSRPDTFRDNSGSFRSLKSSFSGRAASVPSVSVPKINLKNRSSSIRHSSLESHRSNPVGRFSSGTSFSERPDLSRTHGSITKLNIKAALQQSSTGGSIDTSRNTAHRVGSQTLRSARFPKVKRDPPQSSPTTMSPRQRSQRSSSICNLTFADFDNTCHVDEEELIAVFPGKSLNIFAADNSFRIFLTRIVRHQFFDYIIVFIIVINAITLSLEGPWTKDQPAAFRDFLDGSDIAFVVLFTVEAAMKIIVYGFVGDDPFTGCCSAEIDEEQPMPSKEALARILDDDTSRKTLQTTEVRSSQNEESEQYGESLENDISNDEEQEEQLDPETDAHQDNSAADDYEELCPYLCNTWNRVDFAVCITAILGLFIPFFALFRSLRTLRLIIRFPNIKVVVRALFHALPAIGNVLAITSFVFLVFSILGVQLFKGKLYFCSDPSIEFKADCIGTYKIPRCSIARTTGTCPMYFCEWSDNRCVYVEENDSDIWGDYLYPNETLSREWTNSRYHFDNVAESFLTLFQVSLGETWADILWLGVDARATDISVTFRKNSSPANALFFITFMVIGNFFALNLFIGLLIDRFTTLRKELEGSALLTQAQQEWVRSQKGLSKIQLEPRPPRPGSQFRANCFDMVQNEWFDRGIMVAICANVIVMSVRHYNQPDSLGDFEYVANLVFTGIFGLEALLKIVALSKFYFSDSWNRFDFVLVLLSFAGLGVNQSGFAVFRILRIARILRLIKKANELSLLFGTLYYALPSLMNIGLLLLCTYFNFAVIGVQMFGSVRLGVYIDKWLNFRNIGSAVITLYTISTAEKWNDIMVGVGENHRGCEEASDCGASRAVTIVYFTVFMIIGSLITLNLFITVVLENFSEQRSADVAQETLAEFREQWLVKDPYARGWLYVVDFLYVLRSLPPPIGLRRPNSIPEMIRHLRFLSIPVSKEGELRYTDALTSISKKLFNISEAESAALSAITKKSSRREEAFTVYHLFAALRIQERWKRFIAKRRKLWEDHGPMLEISYAAAVAVLTMGDSWASDLRSARKSFHALKTSSPSLPYGIADDNDLDTTLSPHERRFTVPVFPPRHSIESDDLPTEASKKKPRQSIGSTNSGAIFLDDEELVILTSSGETSEETPSTDVG